MPGKSGHHPVEVVAKVQSMELNLDYSGTYKLLLEDGSIIHADFTPTEWGHLQSMHNRGRYSIKFVGMGDYADGVLQRITGINLLETERVIPPRIPTSARFGNIGLRPANESRTRSWRKYPRISPIIWITTFTVPPNATKNEAPLC